MSPKHILAERLERRTFLDSNGLDPSFATGGIFTQTFAGRVSDALMALQSDHKIVMAFTSEADKTHFTVMRLDVDGKFDQSFGASGKTRIKGSGVFGERLEIDPVGRILLLNSNGLARLTSKGKLDSSFGSGGVVTSPRAQDFAIDSMGRIPIINSKVEIQRLDAGGKLDASFGTHSLPNVSTTRMHFSTPIKLTTDEMRVQPDGSVLYLISGESDDFFVANGIARVTSKGKIDTHFGNKGYATGLAIDGDPPQDFAAASDGKILVLGQFTLTELDKNGQQVLAFGHMGNPDFAGFGINVGESVRTTVDGKILVLSGGLDEANERNEPLVVTRLNLDGQQDPTLDSVDLETGLGPDQPIPNDVRVDSNGDVILLSTLSTEKGSKFQVVRIEGTSPASLSQGGVLTVRGDFGENTIQLLPSDDDMITVKVDFRSATFPEPSVKSIVIDAAGGNDTLEIDTAGIPTTALGGNGNDSIRGGGGGPEILAGGAGSDTLVPNADDTTLAGGAGNDFADFGGLAQNLSITLDNQPNDGLAGDHMNVHSDIENIIGGSGNDLIIGGPFAEHLYGGPGNDTLWGGGGNDTLEGGRGHDQLFGQSGDDLLIARDRLGDSLDGGDGFDMASLDDSAMVKDKAVNVEAIV